MDGILRIFGRVLKQRRVAAQMTQEDLAERLGGMHRVSIANWEAGKQSPPFELVVRLAILLDFSLDEIKRQAQSETYHETLERLDPDMQNLLISAFSGEETGNGC